MPCCGCCCRKNLGECCGPPDGERVCCKPPDECCGEGETQVCCEIPDICCGTGESAVCCPPERDCCAVYTIGEGESEVCCAESEYCCFSEQFPGQGICCEDTEVCCLSETGSSCCSPNQYCCDGVCSDTPCCSGACDDENPCDEGCYCCDGTCQDEPCEECAGNEDCTTEPCCVNGVCEASSQANIYNFPEGAAECPDGFDYAGDAPASGPGAWIFCCPPPGGALDPLNNPGECCGGSQDAPP